MSIEGARSENMLKPDQIGVLIGVLSVYLIIPSSNIPNAAMSDLAAIYPELPAVAMSYFLTTANIASMVGAFFFGLFAGSSFRYKPFTIIALCCFIIGGCAPMVLPDGVPFGSLIFSRILLGLGMGCFMPMVQSIIVQLFQDETSRSAWLGIGAVFFNVGITIGSTLAGFLALINWKLAFAYYLIGFIPLIVFSIFFKETDDFRVETKPIRLSDVAKIPIGVWVVLTVFMLAMSCSAYFTSYAQISFHEIGINQAIFGTMMSIRTIGSMIIAASFVFIYRVFKKYVVTVGILFVMISLGLIYFFCLNNNPNLVGLYIAAFILGCGINTISVGMAMLLSQITTPAIATFVLGLNFVFQNLGTFLGSPTSQLFYAIVGEEAPVYSIFLWGAIVAFLLAIISAVSYSALIKRNPLHNFE